MSGSEQTPDVQRMADAIASRADVEKLISLRIFDLAEGEQIIGVKVALAASAALPEIAEIIAQLELLVRGHVPNARSVYVQPDIYRPSIDPAPPTDVFVLRSAD